MLSSDFQVLQNMNISKISLDYFNKSISLSTELGKVKQGEVNRKKMLQ